MRRARNDEKLPVPGKWQAAVLAAMAHLAERLKVPRAEIAVTRTEPAPADGGSLEVWLLSGGQTYRFISALNGQQVRPEGS